MTGLPSGWGGGGDFMDDCRGCDVCCGEPSCGVQRRYFGKKFSCPHCGKQMQESRPGSATEHIERCAAYYEDQRKAKAMMAL